MENEDLVSVSQVNDEFTLISLFFRADIVVKLVKKSVNSSRRNFGREDQ